MISEPVTQFGGSISRVALLVVGLFAMAVAQAQWHGGDRPALKATDPDGQATELLRHAENYKQSRRMEEAVAAAKDALKLLEAKYGPNDRR